MSVLLFRASPHLYTAGPHILFVQHLLIVYQQANLLPMSQHIFLYFSPSSSRFFLTRAFQHSLVSSVMQRYFAVFE